MRIGNGRFVMLWMASKAGAAAPIIQVKTSLGSPDEIQFRNTPPVPTTASGTAEKLKTLLTSHQLILQAGVIYCSSSPMASAFTCFSVLEQVLNSSKKKKTLSHPRRSYGLKKIPHLFEGKMDSLMFYANLHLSQMVNEKERWRQGGHTTWWWNLRVRSPFCIEALLLFLASGLEESIDCDPTPNLSFFWREYNISKFVLL